MINTTAMDSIDKDSWKYVLKHTANKYCNVTKTNADGNEQVMNRIHEIAVTITHPEGLGAIWLALPRWIDELERDTNFAGILFSSCHYSQYQRAHLHGVIYTEHSPHWVKTRMKGRGSCWIHTTPVYSDGWYDYIIDQADNAEPIYIGNCNF